MNIDPSREVQSNTCAVSFTKVAETFCPIGRQNEWLRLEIVTQNISAVLSTQSFNFQVEYGLALVAVETLQVGQQQSIYHSDAGSRMMLIATLEVTNSSNMSTQKFHMPNFS